MTLLTTRMYSFWSRAGAPHDSGVLGMMRDTVKAGHIYLFIFTRTYTLTSSSSCTNNTHSRP